MNTAPRSSHGDSADPSHAESHGGHDAEAHGGSTATFLKVFAALCVLTAISFAVANSPLMGMGHVGWVVMIAVSCAKAMLVISFFMHLKWERAWKYVVTIPASAMALFLVLSLVPDIGFRTRVYSDSRWLHASESTPRPPWPAGDGGAASETDAEGGPVGEASR